MALDRTTGTITILAFGLLFVSMLISLPKKSEILDPIEGFQTQPLLLGYQAKTIPLDHLSGMTDRIYSADGTLLWLLGTGYIQTDDTYKQGAPYYTQEQTVIIIFRALDPMSLDAMKNLEINGTADPNIYGSTIIADLIGRNKVAAVRVIQEVAGAPLYTDGTSVTLKVGPHAMPPGVTATTTATGGTTAAATTGGTTSAATTSASTGQSATTESGLAWWAILLIVLAVLVVLGGAWWFFSRGSTPTPAQGLNPRSVNSSANE